MFYQVVLGSIWMEPPLTQLRERYGESRPETPRAEGKTPLGIVVLDKDGKLVEPNAVGVSSFAWGAVRSLTHGLNDLARWREFEAWTLERLTKRLLGVADTSAIEEADRAQLITRAALLRAFNFLVDEFALPADWVETPGFAIRTYVYFKDPNPPEPILLNSFFLEDLSMARGLFDADKAPSNLRRYLGMEVPREAKDLLRDEAALEDALRPANTPIARWPASGRNPLVLLQQAAVNLAFRENENEGILGINGPPGTGKTTLLRDLVAGVVTARANAMVDFSEPTSAFEHSGQRLKAGDGWLHLYRVDSKLRGYEMVVASSNNKAVENVSGELPSIDAIATDADLRYLKTLSDAVHNRDTWGMVAAVLGNSQNRARFKQTFWWDEDYGLNAYLVAANGTRRTIEISNTETGAVEQRSPHIVSNEKPPSSEQDAQARWNKARRRFLEAKKNVEEWQSRLEKLRADAAKVQGLENTQTEALVALESSKQQARAVESSRCRISEAEAASANLLRKSEDAVGLHTGGKPGMLSRLFRTERAIAWAAVNVKLIDARNEASGQHANLASRLRQLESEYSQVVAKVELERSALAQTKAKLGQVREDLARATQEGITVADGRLFRAEHALRHLATPWFPAKAQRARDELFVAAMGVHRAFMDSAAKPLRHNLAALMGVFTTQALPTPEKQALLSDLWASLFLVVPLVSTTFASVNRMLGRLPLQSLGWLFVDEAGQATPQAVVGALLRAKRAVVVGDPVQIEPVVLLPDTLVSSICRSFGVDPERFSAPSASVQMLADSASAFSSEFDTRTGSRRVGVPLLVHRRCSEPMFGIANAIAYSGLMVSAKTKRPSRIEDVLGPSRWIHVEGAAPDKWNPREGTKVVELLRDLAASRVAPDLYIISPFVVVADGLRRTIQSSGVLADFGIDNEWQWLQTRVGTVHTAQGREAEAVIFVLGAPNPEQTGARNWAGARPNLLNVAMTRAKEVAYVVGNRALWREAGVFRELASRLHSQ
jgi:hypothetical protein